MDMRTLSVAHIVERFALADYQSDAFFLPILIKFLLLLLLFIAYFLYLHLDIQKFTKWQSHPMRVRGLKHICLFCERPPEGSHPMRVRGLKHARFLRTRQG